MELQHRMPFLPQNATTINEHLGVAHQDGRITFFDASGPIFICRNDDEGALRFAAAMLTVPSLGLAGPSQIAKAVGRHRSRVHDYRKRLREGGAVALAVKRRGPRGPSKLTGAVVARAQKFLTAGESNRQVATRVGVSELTIRKGLKDGRLGRPQDAPRKPPSTARALTPTGLLVEALPRFDAAESVAKAGVLVALPALLGQGLVAVGQQLYGSLKHGYYGVTSMLLSFGLMALVRIKSTEGLTHHAPGEFGRVLGLDRAPEMKTARRTLAELAGRGRALEFARAFAERWATEAPDALGYLYIDGHVRPYHGRTRTLPKTHVPRRRLCLPATTDYWVNDANAEPLLFITAPANEGLLAMMAQEVLPQIRTLAGEERRVTLIFDREGWSPKTFRTWTKAGFDVITYRKGTYRDWQRGYPPASPPSRARCRSGVPNPPPGAPSRVRARRWRGSAPRPRAARESGYC